MISNVQANHQNYYGIQDDLALLGNFSYPKSINLKSYYSNEELSSYRDITLLAKEMFCDFIPENNVSSNTNPLPYFMPSELFQYKMDLVNMRMMVHKEHTGDELVIWNGSNLGLVDMKLIENNDGRKLHLDTQIIDYFDIVSTEYALDIGIKRIGKTIRDISQPGPKLCHLSESKLPNHMGVDGLIFTSDNYLIIQMRSKRTILQQGMYYSSVAGTVKDKQSSFNQDGSLNLYQAFRVQAQEELGIKQFTSLKLIGATRVLFTGGSMSFRFVGRVAETKDEFIANLRTEQPEDEWEYDHLEYIKLTGSLQDQLDQLYQLAQEDQDDEGQNLIISCYFYEKYMLERSIDQQCLRSLSRYQPVDLSLFKDISVNA